MSMWQIWLIISGLFFIGEIATVGFLVFFILSILICGHSGVAGHGYFHKRCLYSVKFIYKHIKVTNPTKGIHLFTVFFNSSASLFICSSTFSFVKLTLICDILLALKFTLNSTV